MNIFAGNLSRELTEDDLRELFTKYGRVKSVNIIRDRYTKLSRGFGFCDMPVQEEAEAAIIGLDGMQVMGRYLDISVAVPRKPQKPGETRNGNGRPIGGKKGRPEQNWRFRYLHG